MKKLYITILTLLASGAAYALPVGNPADASLLCDGLFLEGHCGDPCDPCLTWCDAISVRFGFYGDYVFNRHMEIDENERSDDIEETSLYTNAGLIVVNFWDRFDAFVTLGATNLCIEGNEFPFFPNAANPGNGRFEIETSTDFSWSFGIRGSIWECACTTLGVEAQFFQTTPHVSRLTTRASESVYPSGVHAKYYEWQIGVGLAHRINLLAPYAAITWNHSKLDFDNARLFFEGVAETAELPNLDSIKYWGLALGVSLIDCEKASLTVEGRWASEKAVHVNGQVRF